MVVIKIKYHILLIGFITFGLLLSIILKINNLYPSIDINTQTNIEEMNQVATTYMMVVRIIMLGMVFIFFIFSSLLKVISFFQKEYKITDKGIIFCNNITIFMLKLYRKLDHIKEFGVNKND